MSMSANIIRELVSTILKVDAREVILSGVLPEGYVREAVSTSGSMYNSYQKLDMYSFSPDEGLKLIPSIVISQRAASNADGSWEAGLGYDYKYLGSTTKNALFFVEAFVDDYSDSNGNDRYSKRVTLYKSPNFREYFDKLTNEDIARWERWLRE